GSDSTCNASSVWRTFSRRHRNSPRRVARGDRTRLAGFLAEEGMVGKLLMEEIPNRLLRGQVSLSNQIKPSFFANGKAPPPIFQDGRPAPGCFLGSVEPVG